MRSTLFFVAVLGLAGLAAPTSAQTFGRLDDLKTNAAAFFYARPGEATTRVLVWGAVRLPGAYEVTTGTDLAAVLALAGGPVVPPRTDEAERRVTLRVYRAEAGTRRILYEAPFEAFAQATAPPPALRDDDVVEVDVYQKRTRTWRDTLAIVGSGAAIVVAITQVINVLR